jgi:t-SNARE complex subunit (syntaxin)
MSEITKEEIVAYTEAQNKTAVSLEKIVDRLGDCVLKQEKILEKLSANVTTVDNISKSGCGNATVIKEMKEDMKYMKLFWGILTAALAVALIVVEFVHKIGLK